ncbi:MAG: hypothetical protein GY868_02975 [Deltaproteobacteria bacterium]|nr:hypothetical protein [Deltaproteobacteria bacterium]
MKLNFKLGIAVCAVFFVSLCGMRPAAAEISLDISAGDEGFSFGYQIPLLGSEDVALGPNDAPQTISLKLLFIPLADITFAIEEISTSDNPFLQSMSTVKVDLTISSLFFQNINFQIPFPFGDLGVLLDMRGKKLPSLSGGNTFEAALFLDAEQSVYDVAVNSPLLQGDWSNEDNPAGPANPTITEEITGQLGKVLMDIDVDLQYQKFLTKFDYEIGFPAGEQEETEQQEPRAGSLSLPYGSYQVWYNK